MPWMLRRVGGKVCVYKRGEDGKSVGSPRGCHPTRQAAMAQLRALYTHVDEARGKGMSASAAEFYAEEVESRALVASVAAVSNVRPGQLYADRDARHPNRRIRVHTVESDGSYVTYQQLTADGTITGGLHHTRGDRFAKAWRLVGDVTG